MPPGWARCSRRSGSSPSAPTPIRAWSPFRSSPNGAPARHCSRPSRPPAPRSNEMRWPVLLLEHPLALDRFDYTRVGEHGALLRVLARVPSELGEPAGGLTGAELRVSRSQRPWQSFVARGCRIEAAQSDGELIWRGLFAVPFALVHQPAFGFELSAPGLPALTLPVPSLRGALALMAAPLGADPELAVTTVDQLSPEQVARLTGSRMRTRAVALATVLAVTASSTPAGAIADAGFGPSSHAQVTQHR